MYACDVNSNPSAAALTPSDSLLAFMQAPRHPSHATAYLSARPPNQNVFDNVADAHRILREITLLRVLRHPDIVEIKHIMLPSDPNTFKDLYVCFELMEVSVCVLDGMCVLNNETEPAESMRLCVCVCVRVCVAPFETSK